MAVAGQEYYADGGSGELVPTDVWPASIVNPTSNASIMCDGNLCQATFRASHEGMWHWTRQKLNWAIEEADYNYHVAGSTVEKTGGTSCIDWLAIGFCAKKKQVNEHTASASVNECRARAKLSSDHEAGWGIRAEWSAGGWSLSTMLFGEKSVSTSAENLDESRCDLCDDPTTPAVEECGVGEKGETYGDSGTPSGGGGGDCPTCVEQPPDGPTTCWVRYWFNKSTGEVYQVHILYCY
ncbi:MAG: hypothetical protein H0W42_03605 [Gemmatimonadaceae bacterium]|nr:hypothetical protein [Gemmatimonadaceae bacterium]